VSLKRQPLQQGGTEPGWRARLGRWLSTVAQLLRVAAASLLIWFGKAAKGLAPLGQALCRYLAPVWRRIADRLPPGPKGPGWPQRHGWWSDRRVWLAVGGLFAAILLAWTFTLGPVGFGDAQAIPMYIAPGQNTVQIGEQLASLGLIRSAAIFRLWVRLTGTAGSLRAGEYDFARGMSIPDIVAKMTRGEVKLHAVTIPEGYSVAQIQALLVARGFADPARLADALGAAGTNGLIPTEFAAARPALVKQPLEGFLFPDTYMLYRGITEAEILRAMVGRFKVAFAPAMRERAAELGMTLNEVLTLASIIEKEARLPEERAIISGVFHSRLKLRMALQTDPTVRYAMKDPNAPITSRELAIDSPYNTYRYAGLPPGPICSPGLASIQAALYPDDVPYLYFVAKLDGSHAFARTLAEHNANVRKYLGY